eukprot:gb/GECH01004015.1/.p1 GENE.gb/GECH01004015.1/~~gb/GECH01004015.1/.p1  ORF type:complete len:369 (+),score=76.12 gb/GECH01004015.1/:1-1107(+)
MNPKLGGIVALCFFVLMTVLSLSVIDLDHENTNPNYNPTTVSLTSTPTEKPTLDDSTINLVTKNGGNPKTQNDILYTLKIIIFTQKRMKGFQMCLDVLNNKTQWHTNDVRIDLIFMIDASETQEKEKPIIEAASEFPWTRGSKTIIKRHKKGGLRLNILEGWYPAERNEFGLLLEDDVELSPLWFRFVDRVIRAYWNFDRDGENNPRFAGIALWNPYKNEVQLDKPFERPPHNTPFLLAQPCSWGGLYFPETWKQFRHFIRWTSSIPNLPFPTNVNKWPSGSTWKKAMFSFMYQNDMYMIYPNYPQNRSFAFHHRLRGAHTVSKDDTIKVEKARRMLVPPETPLPELPPFDQLWELDMKGTATYKGQS